MAERSINVAESTKAGLRVAARDAGQPDADGLARVVQLVDLAVRPLPALRALRGRYDPYVTEADPQLVQYLVGEWSAGKLFLGDCDRVVCQPVQQAEDGAVTVTPVVYDALGVTVLGVLEPKTSSVPAAPVAYLDGGYYSPPLVWETHGAACVAFHVSAISGTDNAATLWGGAAAERAWPVLAGEWNQVYFAAPLVSSLNVSAATNLRHVIPAAMLRQAAGTKIRLRFAHATSNDYAVSSMYVGLRAESGDAWDMAGSPAAVTVGEDAAFSIDGDEIWSDEIDFAYVPGRDLVLSVHLGVCTPPSSSAMVSGLELWSKEGADESGTADATGYSEGDSGRGFLVEVIDVYHEEA